MLLNLLGWCSERAVGTCVVLCSVLPTLGVLVVLCVAGLVLRSLGRLRTWHGGLVASSLAGFVLGAVWQGVAAAHQATAPGRVGAPDRSLLWLQPWLPTVTCFAAVAAWVLFRLLRAVPVPAGKPQN
jgi:hypothetical protein